MPLGGVLVTHLDRFCAYLPYFYELHEDFLC